MSIWHWLTHGSDVLVLPKSWLKNEARLNAYAEWTERQREGQVVKDSAHFQRQAFWERIDAKRGPRCLQFPRSMEPRAGAR